METKYYGPLIVIVGQTASGKSALAMQLASKFNGEIICADSRTVYKDMDIGTAKPTAQDQKEVKHHLLDVVYPNESFTVAQFKKLTEAAIEEIQSRNKLPILVGGGGLYIDSVIFDYEFRPVNQKIRDTFSDVSIEELKSELTQRGIPLPENKYNPRYLLRSLEAGAEPKKHNTIQPNILIIGLEIEKDELRRRSEFRVEQTLKFGLLEEIKRLSIKYGWDVAPMQAPAYKAFKAYFTANQDIESCIKQNVDLDMKLAKKQKTWFKRNNSIRWYADPSKVEADVAKFLNKFT